jgi:hypothetical protein
MYSEVLIASTGDFLGKSMKYYIFLPSFLPGAGEIGWG